MERKDLKILCIDDEVDILDIYATWVDQLGFTAVKAEGYQQAFEQMKLHSNNLAMVISDWKMPDADGFDIRKKMLPEFERIPFVIVTGYLTKDTALKGIDLGISAFLQKPFDKETLSKLIETKAATRIAQIDEDKELLEGYANETASLLSDIEAGILELERGERSPDLINTIMRLLHTVKGTSACMGFETVSKFAHKYEDLISILKRGELPITRSVVTVLLEAFDVLKSMCQSVSSNDGKTYDLEKVSEVLRFNKEEVHREAKETTKEVGKSGEAPPVQLQSKDSEITVSTELLDEFNHLSGELTVVRNTIMKLVRSIENEHRGDKNVERLSETLGEMHKFSSAIQNRITEVRKVSLKNVFRPLQRVVRDVSKTEGKEIYLKTFGEDLRVDTSIGAALSNCLVHLIRNSCDHGIEKPDVRQASGKPAAGTVTLSCHDRGEEVVIEVKDDGQGIDPNKIRRKLEKEGQLSAEEISKIPEKKLIALIFKSGFSTAEKVTAISGRGVGMDMVKSTIDSIGGTVEIESKISVGTTFLFKLPKPKSVMIINALIVSVQNETFAIPQEHILEVVHVEKPLTQIEKIKGAHFFRLRGELIPIKALNKSLELWDLQKASVANLPSHIVFVRSKGLTAGLIVNEILDNEEIVVKPLISQLKSLRSYVGATFLGDERVVLILNIDEFTRFSKSELENTSTKEMADPSLGLNEKLTRQKLELLLIKIDEKSLHAIPLKMVFRLEKIPVSNIKSICGRMMTQYMSTPMTLVPLKQLVGIKSFGTDSKSKSAVEVVVVSLNGKNYGLIVDEILDIADTNDGLNQDYVPHRSLLGTVFLNDRIVSVINVAVVEAENASTFIQGELLRATA